MFGWFNALRNIKDKDLYDLCGADYTLYLIFLRMTAKLCLVICLFNALIMVPIYVTGDPMTGDDYHIVPTISKMSAATVLNITNSELKM